MGKREERLLGGSGPTLSDSLLRLFRLSLSLSLADSVWAANESESFSCTAVSEGPDESSGAKPRLGSDAPPPAGNWCAALHFPFFSADPIPALIFSHPLLTSPHRSEALVFAQYSTTTNTAETRELHYSFKKRVFALTFLTCC